MRLLKHPSVLARLRFWRRSLVRGTLATSKAMGIVLAILGGSGVAVLVFVGRLPVAWAVALVAALLIAALAEGTYREWAYTAKSLTRAQGLLAEEDARDAVAARLGGCARELELLRHEIPDPGNAIRVNGFIQDLNGVLERVSRELRLHAPELLESWRENPPDMKYEQTPETFNAFIDYTLEQLRGITEQLEEAA
jgi:hypothetical protein